MNDLSRNGRILVVTNDFPPRAGGIEAMVRQLLAQLPPEQVVVHASNQPDAQRYDATLPYPVVRDPTRVLLPTPAVRDRAIATMHGYGCTAVWFAAAAPLGLLGAPMRAAGAARTVATTHGHEIWWSTVPGAKAAMRRVGEVNDVVTFLTEYTRRRIARAFTPAAAARMQRLTSGVDASQFRPGVGREEIRRRYGLGDRPVVVCVSRLVPRKGQDMLIRALPMVRRRIGDVALLLVGEGPDDGRLRDLAERTGVRRQVFFAGRAPWGELSMHLAAGDVFAMPARTRHHGFDVEGLGICYLEAAAVELPVVAGDSGGAGEAVLDGRTGFVVDGGDPAVIADRLGWLLANPDQATAMGRAGRRWVQQRWRPQDQAQALARLLGQT